MKGTSSMSLLLDNSLLPLASHTVLVAYYPTVSPKDRALSVAGFLPVAVCAAVGRVSCRRQCCPFKIQTK
jgi:hypothetical protein